MLLKASIRETCHLRLHHPRPSWKACWLGLKPRPLLTRKPGGLGHEPNTTRRTETLLRLKLWVLLGKLRVLLLELRLLLLKLRGLLELGIVTRKASLLWILVPWLALPPLRHDGYGVSYKYLGADCGNFRVSLWPRTEPFSLTYLIHHHTAQPRPIDVTFQGPKWQSAFALEGQGQRSLSS